MRTRHWVRLGAGLLLGAALLASAGGVLWVREVIAVPAVVVRGIGHVAGAMKVAGAMDVELPVPYHRQEHSLSCEVAALKMALGRYGVAVTEAELIRQLPFDLTPRRGDLWGNPHEGFVGNIDGRMMVDGYGVYWEPIAKLGSRWRRTEVLRGASAAQVAAHVAAGRPVVVWGAYGRPTAYQWRTTDGSVVHAVNGEHARVVTGFSGTPDNPTEFLLLDPIFGRLVWSTDTFERNWGTLGHTGVVVYPHPQWVRVAGDPRVWEISADGTTRRWVTSWEALVKSGGTAWAIADIDEAALMRYKVGAPIS